MFTRIIDPFNNQIFKVPNKPEPTFLYNTKAGNVQPKKMKQTLARNNKNLYPEDIKASDTWTVGEETRSQPAEVEKEKDSSDEIDDFVIV